MAKKPAKPSQKNRDPADMSYEKAVEALESIVDRIESGEIGLEESIHAYRYGSALLRRCRAILDQAEQEIETLDAADDQSAGGGES